MGSMRSVLVTVIAMAVTAIAVFLVLQHQQVVPGLGLVCDCTRDCPCPSTSGAKCPDCKCPTCMDCPDCDCPTCMECPDCNCAACENCPECTIADIDFGPSDALAVLTTNFDEMAFFACKNQDDVVTGLRMTPAAAAAACAADINCQSIQLNHKTMLIDMSTTCNSPVANSEYTTYVKK